MIMLLSSFVSSLSKMAFERLRDRAKRSAWQLEGFNLVRAAVANKTGKVSIWADPKVVDPKASLMVRHGMQASEEKAVTLDLFIKKSVLQAKAFLARIALNGHEE